MTSRICYPGKLGYEASQWITNIARYLQMIGLNRRQKSQVIYIWRKSYLSEQLILSCNISKPFRYPDWNGTKLTYDNFVLFRYPDLFSSNYCKIFKFQIGPTRAPVLHWLYNGSYKHTFHSVSYLITISTLVWNKKILQ